MFSLAPILVMFSLVLLATLTDFRQRRIPNWLTLSGFLAGIAFNGLEMGASGIGSACLGAAIGLLLLLPVYAFGKMGGGDVKLMAMVGAFLGPEGVIWAALFTTIAGGVLALFWILYEVGIRSSLYRAIGTFAIIQLPGREVFNVPENSPLKSKMPYAIAIAAGSLMAVWKLNQH